MTPQQEIGNIIRNARKAKGMTQTELAKRLSVNQAAINKYEKGLIKVIPADKLEILFKELQMIDVEIAACKMLMVDTILFNFLQRSDLSDGDVNEIVILARRLSLRYKNKILFNDYKTSTIETERFLCFDKMFLPNTSEELKNYHEYLITKEAALLQKSAKAANE